jgi:hypothetical protein
MRDVGLQSIGNNLLEYIFKFLFEIALSKIFKLNEIKY